MPDLTCFCRSFCLSQMSMCLLSCKHLRHRIILNCWTAATVSAGWPRNWQTRCRPGEGPCRCRCPRWTHWQRCGGLGPSWRCGRGQTPGSARRPWTSWKQEETAQGWSTVINTSTNQYLLISRNQYIIWPDFRGRAGVLGSTAEPHHPPPRNHLDLDVGRRWRWCGNQVQGLCVRGQIQTGG